MDKQAAEMPSGDKALAEQGDSDYCFVGPTRWGQVSAHCDLGLEGWCLREMVFPQGSLCTSLSHPMLPWDSAPLGQRM